MSHLDELVSAARKRLVNVFTAVGIHDFFVHALPDAHALARKLDDVTQDRDDARAELSTLYKELADKDREIAHLREQCAKKSAELGEVYAENYRLKEAVNWSHWRAA